MKNKFISFFAFIFLIFFSPGLASAINGAMADSKGLIFVTQTKYFDIIYAEESKNTALRIETVCDDYYEEICSLLETLPYQRFPVTITRSVDVLNAYYTALPYNRIVLYDTLPDNSLSVTEKTIESVFYHELTHAVSYNMKSDLFQTLSFFADVMNPAWLTVTSFWAEGVTVSFESLKKGGRLNNPFATQMVNQSKIEKKFPSWRDVTGAKDIYPGGTDAYMFGSMFAYYLQKTYGMSKYATFWKTAGSRITLSFIAGVFKKTYGITITQAWKDFEKTLELETTDYTSAIISHPKTLTSCFDTYIDPSGVTTLVYYDRAAQEVQLLRYNKEGVKIYSKKLFAASGVTSLSFSSDGQKLAVSRNITKKNSKRVVGIYDFAKKEYKQSPMKGVKEAHFVNNNLAYIRIDDYIDTFTPYSPLYLGDNLSAAIIKDSLTWKIRIYNGEDINSSVAEYDFSNVNLGEESRSLIIQKLHKVAFDDKNITLSFTWASLGEECKNIGEMLSRSGIFVIDRASMTGKAYLQKKNAQFGVLEVNPLLFDLDDLKENPSSKVKLFAAAAEYDATPMRLIEIPFEDFTMADISGGMVENSSLNDSELGINGASSIAAGGNTSETKFRIPEEKYSYYFPRVGKNYNIFDYYSHGAFLPFSTLSVYNHDLEADTTSILGASYYTSNPWGDKILNFTTGINPKYGNAGLRLALNGGNDSLKYSVSGNLIFDEKGFMQFCENLSIANTDPIGLVSSLTEGIKYTAFVGRQIINSDFKDNWDDSMGIANEFTLYLSYSNIHKADPFTFHNIGFSLTPFILSSNLDSDKRKEDNIDPEAYMNGGLSGEVQFPIYIPVTIKASYFPSKKYFASASISAILINYEIHRGIPAASVFVQRFLLTASYSGKIAYKHEKFMDIGRTKEIIDKIESDDYSDALTFEAKFYLTPNTGFMAQSGIQIALGYGFTYRPNPKASEDRVSYGITTSVNY